VFGGALGAFVEAFERMGIRDVAIFSAHGGNFAFLERFAAERSALGSETRVVAYADFDGYAGAMFEGSRRGGVDPPVTDVHAGAVETSQGLALFPELVRPHAELVGYVAAEEGWLERMQAEGMQAVSPNGVLGDPSRARPEAGEPVFEAIAAELIRWIADELGYEPSRPG
jgi:creatinine amidohydrolase